MELLRGRPCAEDVVLAFGNFDGVHKGHAHVFAEVCRIAEQQKLAAAVLTFQPHPVVFLKHCENFLLCDFKQKVQLIGACGVDYLCVEDFDAVFSKMPPEQFISDILVKNCRAKYVVVGDNCVFGYRCAGNLDVLKHHSESYGYKVVSVGQLDIDGEACSSSAIRELLTVGDVETASNLLGRNHDVRGKVIRGCARGRTIGFPTLNLSLEGLVLPRRGVYKARASIDGGEWLPGVVNIGIRPTFSDGERTILEMHIFDFDKDIYGRNVTVELLGFVRPERKFQDIEQLVGQIARDVATVRGQLGT